MRAIAIILIVVGVGLHYVYPRLIATKTGEILIEAPVYERGSKQWREIHIDLSPAQNPVRVLVEIEHFRSSGFVEPYIDLVAILSDPEGEIEDEDITISTGTGESNNPAANTYSSFGEFDDFEVEMEGEHHLLVKPKRDLNYNLSKVTAKIMVGGSAVSNKGASFGRTAMIVGAVLFFISLRKRRRKKARRRNDGGPPPLDRSKPQLGEKPVDKEDVQNNAEDSIWNRPKKTEEPPQPAAPAPKPPEPPKKQSPYKWGRQPKD